MSFTDEEVARLRHNCTNPTGRFYTHIDFDRGIALLDRLEAAEQFIQHIVDSNPTADVPNYVKESHLYSEWRKAAGK